MRILCSTLFGLLLWTQAVLALAVEAPPARSDYHMARDLQIQVKARQRLLADEELAPFNLGVTVHNGTAVIWGPISTPAQEARALKQLENVRGVYKVKSEMYLSPLAGVLPEPGDNQLLPDLPEQSASAMPDRRTGELPVFPAHLGGGKVRESAKPVVLMTPVIEPPVAPEDESEVRSAIEKVQRSDERFRPLQYELKSGALYVRGAKQENVMAFARALSNIPGIERVIVQKQAVTR